MKLGQLIMLYITINSSAIAQGYNAIDEGKYVNIGGIEQWITIKGNDIEKPVILFLHGGPGSVLSPYSDNVYGDWTKDFVLVNWDQRGAGRTFGKNAPEKINEEYWTENKLTLDQMVSDGIEVAEYLRKYLKKEKIVIIGTSWGSILGIKMAFNRPGLFHAYIGNSQFVGFTENAQFAHFRTLKLAKESKDVAAIEALETLGAPPYEDARSWGRMLRTVKKYEEKNAGSVPQVWWRVHPDYDNETDEKNRFNGDDYSFLHFVGHKKLGVESMALNVDFSDDHTEFEIPIFFVQGGEDILTPKEISKPYFDKISAPYKNYFFLPKAGHGQNQDVVRTQYEILKKDLISNRLR